MSMRLCIRAGIPPIGIPLDANRCAGWIVNAHETFFNLEQLEDCSGEHQRGINEEEPRDVGSDDADGLFMLCIVGTWESQ